MIIKIENKDVQEVIKREFIDYIPWRLEYAIHQQMGSIIKSIVNHLDFIDFHYRRYLIGQSKNLGRVNYELRAFFDKHPQSIGLILDFLDLMEEDLLKMEVYELMNRFNNSRVKIKKYIQKLQIHSNSV